MARQAREEGRCRVAARRGAGTWEEIRRMSEAHGVTAAAGVVAGKSGKKAKATSRSKSPGVALTATPKNPSEAAAAVASKTTAATTTSSPKSPPPKTAPATPTTNALVRLLRHLAWLVAFVAAYVVWEVDVLRAGTGFPDVDDALFHQAASLEAVESWNEAVAEVVPFARRFVQSVVFGTWGVRLSLDGVDEALVTRGACKCAALSPCRLGAEAPARDALRTAACSVRCHAVAQCDSGGLLVLTSTKEPVLRPVVDVSPANAANHSIVSNSPTSALWIQLDGRQACVLRTASGVLAFSGPVRRAGAVRVPRGGSLWCSQGPSLGMLLTPVVRISRGEVLTDVVRRFGNLLKQPDRNPDAAFRRLVSFQASGSGPGAGTGAGAGAAKNDSTTCETLVRDGKLSTADVLQFWTEAVAPATASVSQAPWFSGSASESAAADELADQTIPRFERVLRQSIRFDASDVAKTCVVDVALRMLRGRPSAGAAKPDLWWSTVVTTSLHESRTKVVDEAVREVRRAWAS